MLVRDCAATEASPAAFVLLCCLANALVVVVLGLVDKQPVVGATLQLFSIADGTSRYEQRVTTDESGTYVAHAAQGNILIQVVEAPDEYVPLNPDAGGQETKRRLPTIDIKQDTLWSM